jgi:cytochrome c553
MKKAAMIRAICAVAVMTICGAAAPMDPPPSWAFIVMKKGPDWPKGKPVTVPGSKLSVTAEQLQKNSFIADWHPGDHPKPPVAVDRGNPKTKQPPCAECHFLTGTGGPDSAVLAGLPADYIVRQFDEFRSGRRGCAVKESEPCAEAMQGVAKKISPADLRAAAEYFSKLPYRRHMQVAEAASVPKFDVVWYTNAPVKGAKREPIGERIAELNEDMTRYLAADWRAPVTAYVPPGSLKRGKALVEKGAGAMPCASCHGVKFQGLGTAPPLAGQSPSYLYRQLYNIQYGFRKGPAVALMLPEVAHLTNADRIAIAAYLASLPH